MSQIEECLSTFNINGTLRKGQKSKLIQKFDFTDLKPLESYIALVDMGCIWRSSTTLTEDRENKTKVSIHGELCHKNVQPHHGMPPKSLSENNGE